MFRLCCLGLQTYVALHKSAEAFGCKLIQPLPMSSESKVLQFKRSSQIRRVLWVALTQIQHAHHPISRCWFLEWWQYLHMLKCRRLLHILLPKRASAPNPKSSWKISRLFMNAAYLKDVSRFYTEQKAPRDVDPQQFYGGQQRTQVFLSVWTELYDIIIRQQYRLVIFTHNTWSIF